MRSISVLYYRICQGIETLLTQTTMSTTGSISAIVPARNEEAVIAACIGSLAAQPEIAEIIAVNDQSSDRTLEILQDLAPRILHLPAIEATPPPPAWSAKNH